MKRTTLCLIVLLASGLLLGSGTVWASEDKNIVKIGSDVTIETGTKVRNVVTIAGQITVDGTVDNNVVALGGSIVLTKKAVVGGNVFSLGGVIVSARDAQVGGSMTEINSSNLIEILATVLSSEWEGWSWIVAIVLFALFLVILVVALLTAALLPTPVRIIGDAITENTFKVVLCGILVLVSVVPLALLLTVSVVGIALIPLEIIIVACSILLGLTAVGQKTGQLVRRRKSPPHPGFVRDTFLGLVIIFLLIGWIPYVGWMVKVMAIVISLGAVFITRFGTHPRKKHALSPAAPVPPASGAPLNPMPDAPIPPVPVEPALPTTTQPGDTPASPGDAQEPTPEGDRGSIRRPGVGDAFSGQ